MKALGIFMSMLVKVTVPNIFKNGFHLLMWIHLSVQFISGKLKSPIMSLCENLFSDTYFSILKRSILFVSLEFGLRCIYPTRSVLLVFNFTLHQTDTSNAALWV